VTSEASLTLTGPRCAAIDVVHFSRATRGQFSRALKITAVEVERGALVVDPLRLFQPASCDRTIGEFKPLKPDPHKLVGLKAVVRLHRLFAIPAWLGAFLEKVDKIAIGDEGRVVADFIETL